MDEDGRLSCPVCFYLPAQRFSGAPATRSKLLLMLAMLLHCRFMKSPGQEQHYQQQQQQFAFQDNYWDPLVSDDPQSFKYGPPFGQGFNNNGGQG